MMTVKLIILCTCAFLSYALKQEDFQFKQDTYECVKETEKNLSGLAKCLDLPKEAEECILENTRNGMTEIFDLGATCIPDIPDDIRVQLKKAAKTQRSFCKVNENLIMNFEALSSTKQETMPANDAYLIIVHRMQKGIPASVLAEEHSLPEDFLKNLLRFFELMEERDKFLISIGEKLESFDHAGKIAMDKLDAVDDVFNN